MEPMTLIPMIQQNFGLKWLQLKKTFANLIPDEYIEKLNGMQSKWVAGKNFDSVEQVIPLLGAWKDQRSEEERFYRKGSLYAASNYEGKDEIANNHKSQFFSTRNVKH